MYNADNHRPDARPVAWRGRGAVLFLAAALLGSCSSPKPAMDQRAREARYEFNRVVREYHVPMSEATNDLERGVWMTNALAGYEAICRDFGDQAKWAAQSLRSMGNVYLAQGDRARALRCYDQVGRDYPGEHWEVIQAWKSAGDLLWDSGMKSEGAKYFSLIVQTYAGMDEPPMFKTLVEISRDRLAGIGAP